MRAVSHVDVGVVEINYMWLPTWIGMNIQLLNEIGELMREQCLNQVLDDALLDQLHERVLDIICDRYPNIHGLREHLQSLSRVSIDG